MTEEIYHAWMHNINYLLKLSAASHGDALASDFNGQQNRLCCLLPDGLLTNGLFSFI